VPPGNDAPPFTSFLEGHLKLLPRRADGTGMKPFYGQTVVQQHPPDAVSVIASPRGPAGFILDLGGRRLDTGGAETTVLGRASNA
jgi:hypothetical protein